MFSDAGVLTGLDVYTHINAHRHRCRPGLNAYTYINSYPYINVYRHRCACWSLGADDGTR